MKKRVIAGLVALGVTRILFAAAVLVEAEAFQASGEWTVEHDARALGGQYLSLLTPARDRKKPFEAVTVMNFRAAARYHVWVRSLDFASNAPRSRHYRAGIDGVLLPDQAGTHGRDGWRWQQLGVRDLSAGQHLLTIVDDGAGYARCDALLFLDSDDDPNTWLNKAAFTRCRRAPLNVPLTTEERSRSPAGFVSVRTPPPDTSAAARLETPSLRMRFLPSVSEAGETWFIRRTEVRTSDGRWVGLRGGDGDECLSLQYAEKAPVTTHRVVRWKGRYREIGSFVFNGVRHAVRAPLTDPYCAGSFVRLRPTAVRQLSADAVEVRYVPVAGADKNVTEVCTVWKIDPDDPACVRVSASFTAGAAGCYMLGFTAGGETLRKDAGFVLLSPLYQFQRIPENQPTLLADTLTPHPFALVERSETGTRVTSVVSAEPEDLPFEWAVPSRARYGFTLQNARGEVQPGVFAPILGTDASRLPAGGSKTVRWRFWNGCAGWKDAFLAYSENNARVRDYRRPVAASLSEAILNMFDLMNDDRIGGWDTARRGFYDIETKTMVKQAAPLTLLSAAVVSRNEALWERRGRPSLEFMLSRTRDAVVRPDEESVGYPRTGQITLNGSGQAYSRWEGAFRLTGEKNPWLIDYGFPHGENPVRRYVRRADGWSELIFADRLRPGSVSAAELRAAATRWTEGEVFGRQTVPKPFQAFYNIHFYPAWWNWNILDAVCPDVRAREAAFEGAFLTMAGLWSHPRVPMDDRTVRVFPTGSAGTEWHEWFKDEEPFRLGWPRHPGDTPATNVPAWEVAQVGLGLEQPSTYAHMTFAALILQSTWAPHLLRLSASTNGPVRRLLETYARNTIIGRFATYPGYYLHEYNVLPFNTSYPSNGPDLTSFYYHHIPVQCAFALDYLVTDMSIRSGGKIRFPFVVQKNYAWFNNQLPTAEPGHVYDDDRAVVWLERGIVEPDTPDVDWLCARSPERFWLFLANQTDRETPVTAKINSAKIGVPGRLGRRYDTPGAPDVPIRSDGSIRLVLPPRGFVALAWNATRQHAFPEVTPLTAAWRTQKRPDGSVLGIYPIRSPWGRDGLYVVLTTELLSDHRPVRFTCAGRTIERRVYPYEATFPDVPPDADVTVEYERSEK